MSAKDTHFSEKNKLKFLTGKERYNNLIHQKQFIFNQNTLNALENVRDSKICWKTVNKYRHSTNSFTPLDIISWANYFKSVLPPRTIGPTIFIDARHPLLDNDISHLEVKRAIRNAELDKFPGPNKITNNFYKALPENWIRYYESLFSKILYEETIPGGWAES